MSPPSPPPHKHAFVLLQILFTLTLVIAGHQSLNLQHPCHDRRCQVLGLKAYLMMRLVIGVADMEVDKMADEVAADMVNENG